MKKSNSDYTFVKFQLLISENLGFSHRCYIFYLHMINMRVANIYIYDVKQGLIVIIFLSSVLVVSHLRSWTNFI